MTNEERFKLNVERWARLNPDAAQKLSDLKCKNVVLYQNEDESLNLKKIFEDPPQYFYSPPSPQREAQQWFLALDLENSPILYVYGIGLGYYFDVLKDWLKGDSKRYVVFLEDNLEVIKCFLETERASDFLSSKQAKLFYFSWENSYFSLGFITSLFPLSPYKISALRFYQETQPKSIGDLYTRIAYYYDMRLGASAEFLALNPDGFIGNYYKNLLELPRSKLELKMKGQFQGVPAIICGAGPSLAKNIDVLKNLRDKALIMAGGTAMNVLNGAGIMPHFGLGIDPNVAHYKRLISNIAFEEPFFYRQRMYNRALKIIQGERILVIGAGGYRLPTWFEEKLGIPSGENLEEGHNVVNFNLSIARELGCNPIIIVGVDLAYSNNLSYAPGLVRHAIHEPKDAFLTKYSHEELLLKNDINGVPVNTLWKWVNESVWFSKFAHCYPELTLLNCTEGGIGFLHVPNMKLADAAEKYLTQTYDFSSLIHGEIQNSAMPEGVTLQKIVENIEIIARSLLNCEGYSHTLITEFGKIFQKIQNEETIEQDFETPMMRETREKLEAEVGYKHILQDYKERFVDILQPRLQYLESDTTLFTQKEITVKKMVFDLGLYDFFAQVSRQNINIISKVLKDFVNKGQRPIAQPSKKALIIQDMLRIDSEAAKDNEVYSYQNNCLKICDPEQGLDYKKVCVCEEKNNLYSSGALKTKVHWLENKMHGPAFFYAENGQILAQNWYIDGLQEGKGWFYYPSGELYAIKRYKKGLLNGRQEYYYQNGLPKSLFYYEDGLIDDETLLFYDDGGIKREMHFSKGKRDGIERMWNEEGLIILEANYKNDVPCGTAREWYGNGNLAKEIAYAENSDELVVKEWQENGSLISTEELQGKDYFNLVTHHSNELNKSLQNLYQTLINITPSLPEQKIDKSSTTIEQDLLILKQELEKLNNYNHEILVMGGYSGKNPKEAVWKTPEVEKMMRTQMDEINKKLADAAALTQVNLKDLFNIINELKQQEESENQNNPPAP